MARYDRIARLACPDREDCFPGWLTLRDIDGREREPELGRRARLRFLALRPVHRLLARGLDGPSGESLRQQLEGVRREIERLDTRDPERALLMSYLAEVGGRSPLGLVTATLDVGAAAESAGHSWAAEEFYRIGLDLARDHHLTAHEVRALRRLARVHRGRGQWEEAIRRGREAADRAEAVAEPVQWAMALDEVAHAEIGRGDDAAGRAILAEVAARGEENGDAHVAAVAAASLCALELAAGRAEAAILEGEKALAGFPMTDPHRNTALLNVAAALRRFGLWSTAESCYHMVETRSTWVEHRAEAATERAVVAAERGDAPTFRRRRARIVERMDDADLRLRALLNLGLGRGCLVAGEIDDGRDHLRQAISAARDADLDLLLHRAEELLAVLERGDALASKQRPRPAPEVVRRAAERIEQAIGGGVAATS